MKEVLINGVTYVPASSLAKQFRYTSDYIGQLCRAKKVDAQLIGRSWYVNPTSLASVREKRYSRDVKAKVAGGATHEIAINIEEPVKVASPLAKATVKMQAVEHSSNFAKRIDWKPLRYEDDSADLLPSLKKSFQPKSLKVHLADSSDIAIKSSTKSTTLVPDEMPSVILKGKVSVSSLEEAFDLTEELLAEDDITFPDIPGEAAVVPEAVIIKPRLDHKPLVPTVRLKSHRPVATKTKPVAQSVPIEVTGLNTLEWGLVVVNCALLFVVGLVAFSQSSLTATTLEFVQNFEFETRSLQALVSSFLL